MSFCGILSVLGYAVPIIGILLVVKPDNRDGIAEHAQDSRERHHPRDVLLWVLHLLAGVSRELEPDPAEDEDADDRDEDAGSRLPSAQSIGKVLACPRSADENAEH